MRKANKQPPWPSQLDIGDFVTIVNCMEANKYEGQTWQITGMGLMPNGVEVADIIAEFGDHHGEESTFSTRYLQRVRAVKKEGGGE